jgi:hypothetical protein
MRTGNQLPARPPAICLTSDNVRFSEARTQLRGWTLRELASGDDRCRSSGLATRRDQLPSGIRVGALAKRNPNACTNTRFGVPICSLPDVLRRPPMHTGRKSWEAVAQKSNMGCSPGHSWATLGSDQWQTAVTQSERDWRLFDCAHGAWNTSKLVMRVRFSSPAPEHRP